MMSFNEYTIEKEKKRKREAKWPSRQAPATQADSSDTGKASQPSPAETDSSPMILGVLEQMVAAKLIEQSTGEPGAEPDVAGAARSLGDRIVAVHRAVMGDAGVSLQTKRLSYQNMCLAFLGVLAIVGAAGRTG